MSITTFCTQSGVPRATFTLWQHEARMAAAKAAGSTRRVTPSFARVEVVPAPAYTAPAGITVVIRARHGDVAELAGLDAMSVVSVLRAVFGKRRR